MPKPIKQLSICGGGLGLRVQVFKRDKNDVEIIDRDLVLPSPCRTIALILSKGTRIVITELEN